MLNIKPVIIDTVGVEEKVSRFNARSIKKGSKVEALKLAMSMMDLTTLDAKDTPGKVRQLCRKAITPDAMLREIMPDLPSAAAVCVYPNLVRVAKKSPGRLRRESGRCVDCVSIGNELTKSESARNSLGGG